MLAQTSGRDLSKGNSDLEVTFFKDEWPFSLNANRISTSETISPEKVWQVIHGLPVGNALMKKDIWSRVIGCIRSMRTLGKGIWGTWSFLFSCLP